MLFVRRGRVVGRLGTVVDRVEEVNSRELAGSILRELYGERSPPPLVLIPDLPPDHDTFRAWLSERRGGPVELRVPKRGGKRRLMETAGTNAAGDVRPSPAATTGQPQRPGAGAAQPPGGSGPARAAPSDRGLRTSPP